MSNDQRTEDETAEVVDEGGPTRFALPAQADVRFAAEIYSLCRDALDADGDVTIDCGDVERVDAAVLQCVGSLANGLRQGGRQLDLAEPSEPFNRAVSVLGLDGLLSTSS